MQIWDMGSLSTNNWESRILSLKSRGFLMVRPGPWGRLGERRELESARSLVKHIMIFFNHLIHIQGCIYRVEKGVLGGRKTKIICSTFFSRFTQCFKLLKTLVSHCEWKNTIGKKGWEFQVWFPLGAFKMVLPIHIWPCQQ